MNSAAWDVTPYDPYAPLLLDETDGARCYSCNVQRWDADKELPYRICILREADLALYSDLGRLCPKCAMQLTLHANK